MIFSIDGSRLELERVTFPTHPDIAEASCLLTRILDPNFLKLHSVEDLPGRVADEIAKESPHEPQMVVCRELDVDDNQVIVGALTFVRKASLVRRNVISEFAVREDYRSMGVGSRILRFAESQMRSDGMRRVRLTPIRAAKSFYQHNGYTAVAEDKWGFCQMIKNL